MQKKYKYCPICGNELISKMIEHRRRLVCRECGWINYDNPKPVAVCVAKNIKGQVFVAKRNTSPGLNKWALPGGFVEKGEDPEDACLRELREETGMRGKITRLLGVFTHKVKIYENVLVIGYEVDVLNDAFLLNKELKEAKFFDLHTLPKIPFTVHINLLDRAFK